MFKKLITYVICIILLFIIGASVLFDFNNKANSKKIVLAEVAHTVFYAPLYVAIENNYFKDNDIDIDLILTSGADKVSAALLSGDADIGLCGSEATIYVYNQGEKDYLQTFSQLTQKDGSFIVSRNKINDFKLNDLKNKYIIGGRAGGMPEMILEYSLKSNGIDPDDDLYIDTSISFASMSGAFIGGTGDFVSLFEPTASILEKNGYGYIVASLGDYGGVIPYTSFSARKSFIEDNKDIIVSFNNSIQMGIDYVNSHSSKDIANVIYKQFPDTTINDLIKAIDNYKKIESWPNSTEFSKKSFDHLQDIMIDYGEIKKKVDYNKLVKIIK